MVQNNSSVSKNVAIREKAYEISALLRDKSGGEFMQAMAQVYAQTLGFVSCCIYDINQVQGVYRCDLQSAASSEYKDLCLTVLPSKVMIHKVIERDIRFGNASDEDWPVDDELLVKHRASCYFSAVLRGIDNQIQGMLLLIGADAKPDAGYVESILKEGIPRLNSELERVKLSKQLNKATTDYRYLVETSRDMIWKLNDEGVFVEVSRSSVAIYGYQREEMKGRHYSEFMSEHDAREFKDYLQKAILGNGIYDIVANHISKNGQPKQVIYNAKPKFDLAGNCIGFTGTTTDITESVRAQVAIKNNSELFSAMLSRLPVIFFCIDDKGTLVDIRGQGLKRMGVDDLEWVGKPAYGLFVGLDDKVDAALSGDTVYFETKGMLHGESWWFYTSLFFDNWSGYGAVGFAVDITEQKHSEEILVHLLKDNRKLAQRLVEVQEEERRNLARELHDELGQSITAVKSLAKAITAKSGDTYSEVRSLGNSIVDLSARLYDVVNNLMRRLRPDILDSLGFEATIRSCIVNSHLERMGVNCDLIIEGEIDDLNEVVQITVYRIVQECLTNISKYAMASNIDIYIKREMLDANKMGLFSALAEKAQGADRDILCIIVQDDGIGMDLEFDLKSTETEQKNGLQGIQERVTALGGNLSIESRPGDGAKIEAILDLSTPSEKLVPDTNTEQSNTLVLEAQSN